MSKVLITRSKLDNLANTISTKSGVALPLTIVQMDAAVQSIPTPTPTPEPWVRPSDWPDLSKMDVSGGDILYMTSYADEGRGFCRFSVVCTGSYTVEVGTISGSTFTAESTQDYANNNYCGLYYGSQNGTYKVLRVTGTAIKKLIFSSAATTIDGFNGYSCNQGIIDIVGKLPSGTGLNCTNQYNLVNVEIGGINLSGSCSNMFNGCYSLTSLDVSDWNTSSVTSMNSMFQNCTSLRLLDVSDWNTSSVTNMGSMFYNCTSLTSLDVSGFDTGSVTSMSTMFQYCYSLTSLDVSSWDTGSVTSMSTMFSNCYSLTSLDVSGFDTGSVTTMASMFSSCYSLTSLDVSDWNTSSVTSMNNMFSGCYSLTSLNVSGFNTSSVTTMASMFNGCYSLTSLDVSGFDTGSVTNMSNMFSSCYSLVSIDVSGWDFTKVTTSTNASSIFSACYGLRTSLTLPASMTMVGSSCFSSCRSITEWHFLATTPPTLSNTNAFGSMTDYGGKKIYVPAASLTAYQTATNWSTYASYMVGE